jgi:hypothetical protein
VLACAAAGLGCGPAGGDDPDGGAADAAVPPDSQSAPDAFDPGYYTDDDGDQYSENQGDCDDADPTVHPFAEEICDDGKDNNCNFAVDEQEPDADGDGYGPCNGDCDDTNPAVSPAAQETPDGTDNDCDGIVDGDYDGDGFTEAAGDCDDDDDTVHPDAAEICWDGVDNDCDGAVDGQGADADGDGWGPCDGDCDDQNAAINPGVAEIAGDGVDNNCDFLIDQDVDGDGWTAANGDCDDADPQVYPGATEDCGDGVDNNCNGLVDSAENTDNDGDGAGVCDGDCDDWNPGARPGFVEDPTDGVDNDCDGQVDEAPQCDCSAANEAQAMDLCVPQVTVSYGGNGAQHGLRVSQSYGAISPRQGCGFVTLSTGPAWSTAPEIGTSYSGSGNPVSTTGCFACTQAGATQWHHMGPQGCCENENVNDVAWIRLEVPVPLNAQGFSFDFLFLSAEYPEWVHTSFNDTFYAVLQTSALSQTQNISFDVNNQPLTVNNGWFETPPNWTQSIAGTGYDATDASASPPYIGSASGWLTTTSPCTPGETLVLTFWIHDEGDHIYDSAVVIDNWRWEMTPVPGPVTIK